MGQGLKSFTSVNDLSKDILKNVITSKTLEENIINYDAHNILGQEYELQLSEFVLTSKNVTSNGIFEMNVSSNCPVIKLHFSLKGNFCYQCNENDNLDIVIPEGFCNLYCFPLIKGKEKFSGKQTRTLEVLFTKDYLISKLGDELTDNLINISSALERSKPCVFFQESKPIPLKLRNQINEIINCSYTGNIKKSYLKSRLTILLIDFLIAKPKIAVAKESLPQSDYLAVVKVEEFCRANLKKKLNITNLSQIAGFNTTKLKRDFKKIFKTTIFKHITQLRMEKAKQLIQEEGYSIAAASYEVGYSNPQHFTTAFKKKMGYLPSQLIKGY